MSLPSVTSKSPIIWAQLSRGGELYAQSQRLPGEFASIELNCVLVEESHGAVASFCKHWTEEFINGPSDLASKWRAERNISPGTRLPLESIGGVGAVGIVTISSLQRHSFVALFFHLRLDRLVRQEGIRMASVARLGMIKSQERRDPRARPHPRRLIGK